jgi:predicted PurR-regulated permease PerM
LNIKTKGEDMEIVYFVLGVVTVLLILGVVVIVKVSRTVNDLNDRIGSVERQIEIVEDGLNRRIDDLDRELNSQIDSRLDKLHSKIKQKDLLKG